MTDQKKHVLPSSLKGLTDEISRRMPDKTRFEHTISVAYECLSIAEYFTHIDTVELCKAALLHDVAKGLSIKEFEELDRKYSIGFTVHDLEAPAVMHAKAGAMIASREFSASVEVAKAIAEHTTGAPDMSLISKILFIADYVEVTRKWESCKQSRRELYLALEKEDSDPMLILDLTIVSIIDKTAAHIESTGRKVHPDSLLCKEFILKNRKSY